MSILQPHLGILVDYIPHTHPPFSEKGFYKRLSHYGSRIGMKVTVFSPLHVRWDTKQVVGYQYHIPQKRWKKGVHPIPPMLYDRIFYTRRGRFQRLHSQVKRLLLEENSILLAQGLPGKWKVYDMCKNNKQLNAFFPETIHYQKTTSWMGKLKLYRALFFKPANGSQGKGVFKLSALDQGIKVEGRTFSNQFFSSRFASYRGCNRWLKKWIDNRSYIFQPYLELHTNDDLPFDMRILVQKNNNGNWEETGRAIRIGRKKGLTSNLQGGGRAVDAHPFLAAHFSAAQLQRISKQLETIISLLPPHLEKKHGPLFELGIDIGVDRQAGVWILEVNSKPGRKSFRTINNQQVLKKALLAPIHYAQYLLVDHEGRERQ